MEGLGNKSLWRQQKFISNQESANKKLGEYSAILLCNFPFPFKLEVILFG